MGERSNSVEDAPAVAEMPLGMLRTSAFGPWQSDPNAMIGEGPKSIDPLGYTVQRNESGVTLFDSTGKQVAWYYPEQKKWVDPVFKIPMLELENFGDPADIGRFSDDPSGGTEPSSTDIPSWNKLDIPSTLETPMAET